MSYEEKRLFHRYPSGLRAAFRIGGTGFRGMIVNVGAGGGFVATKAPPTVGTRVQMAAQVDRTQPSVWLDLRVTWVSTDMSGGGADGSGSVPTSGFGGFWLHASSRHGEEPLSSFLRDVLGIGQAIIRPMTPPHGGAVVHVYRFPDIYDGAELSDIPWWAGRERPPPRRPVSLAAAPGSPGLDTTIKASAASTRAVDPRAAARGSAASTRARGGDAGGDRGFDLPTADEIDDIAPVPASVGSNTGVFFADVSDEVEPPRVDAAPPEKSSAWNAIVGRFSGLRSRDKTDASPASGARVRAPGLPTVEYMIGKKASPATLSRIGTGWVVLTAQAGAKAPEVWSRLVVTLKPPAGHKGENVDVNATVTRIKEAPDGVVIHCKVNNINERGKPGTYASYVEAFNNAQPT